MKQGIVLEALKKVRVTPVYKKKGASEDLSNYRPISVASHAAKILEKAVNIQLYSYLEDNHILSSNQSAYRPAHSTATALHNVVDQWLQNQWLMENTLVYYSWTSENVSTVYPMAFYCKS